MYTVFNAKQIEGIPEWTPKQRSVFEVVEAAEQILETRGATIRHDQADRAFYNRSSDSIHLPPKHAFKDAASYYGTALHEAAHSSGHPSRLNRVTLNESYRFGDISYAKEELRAELASVFLAAERGIPHDPEQHAAYVGSWIKALKRIRTKSSAPRMMLPEQPISCSPWNGFGLLPSKCPESGARSIRPSLEDFPI